MIRNDDRTLLLSAMKKAGEVAMSHFGRASLKTWTKKGEEPVSEADLAVNEALKKSLLEARPDYAWMSEESQDDLSRLSKSHVWVVDPIDGTRAFIKAKKDFSISVALLKNKVPVLGMIYAPAMEKLYAAEAGKGAFLNDMPIKVSNPGDLKGIILESDAGYIGNTPKWEKPWPDMKVGKHQSFALRLAVFAAGEADAVLAARPKSEWDVAAGAVLIKEAGGILCNQNGREFLFNQENTRLHQIVAIGPALKDKFLERVRGRT